jgi:drug/metabolite transporter (DMT)-like permease
MRSGHPMYVSNLLRSGPAVEVGAGRNGREHRPSGWRVAAGFAAIYLIWGTTYLAIRYAVETIPPFLMMALRHTTAGLVVYAWARNSGAVRPRWAQWGYAAVAGTILFLGGHGVLAWAEEKVPSGLAALLCATLPLWMVVVGRLKGVEGRLGARVWLGLLLGFAGVALLIGPDALKPGSSLNLLAAGVVVLSALLWAVGTIYAKSVRVSSSAVLSAAMQMLMGGLSLFVASGAGGEWRGLHLGTFSTRSVLALAYLIVFGSIIAFTVFTWLMTVSSPSRVSTYAYVNPVIAVLVGWALASEPVGVHTVVATGIILTGVLLVNTRRKEEPESRNLSFDEWQEAAEG